MSGTQDFVINGVITSNPDDARAEPAHETTTERKVLKVYDIQNICQRADKWAEIFDSPLSRYHFGGVLNCDEIDATAELLDALGKSEEASGLRDQHNQWRGGDLELPETAARHTLHAANA